MGKLENILNDYYDLKKVQKNLLLGNGLSISIHDRFSYENLLRASSKIDGSRKAVYDLFYDFKTSNFEDVMGKFQDSLLIYDKLNISSDESRSVIQSAIKSIREIFLKSLNDVHPRSLCDIHNFDKINALHWFLSFFDSVFTTNYDLLIYWVLSKFNYKKTTGEMFSDGFGRKEGDGLVWSNMNIQNLFYIHGALHIKHSDSFFAEKVEFIENGVSILDQVRENLEKSYYPIIILEGTSSQKINSINSSAYLSFCFERLKRIQGHLFIHGSSFGDNDSHIYESIFSNKDIKRLYVSAHGESYSQIKNKINMFSDKYKREDGFVKYYDSESVFSVNWSAIGNREAK